MTYIKIKIFQRGYTMIRLRDLREDNDLLQKEIAKILNVSQQQYSRCETGENQLAYDGLIKLVKQFLPKIF